MRQNHTISLALSLGAILIMALLWRGLLMITSPLITVPDFRVYVTDGYNSSTLIKDIETHNPSSKPDAKLLALKFLLHIKRYDENIKQGSYIIREGYSAKQVAALMYQGLQTPVKVVIKGSRELGAMANQVQSQLMMDSTQMVIAINELFDSISKEKSPASIFTLIIPDTYEFYWNVSPKKFAARMLAESEKFWNPSRSEKALAAGLTPFEVITLASIVEEETAMISEMPVVAGLYINRLRKGMPLQADPTVIFALGERPKRVLYEHLKVESPYNTYLYSGLPPAPIRFATPQSIDAVLNYTHHNYIYMCAKEDFSGYHNFTSSLTTHNVNARRYQQALDKKK